MIRRIRYASAHFTPGGWTASNGTRDERDGSLEAYDELVLECGHRLLTKPRLFRKPTRFTHRCVQCVKAVDRKATNG